jgi:anthranilate phosphoribosyltransferase
LIRGLLSGRADPAVEDVVILNAAAATCLVDGSSTVEELLTDLPDAIDRCRSALSGGRAAQVLEEWVAASRTVRGRRA